MGVEHFSFSHYAAGMAHFGPFFSFLNISHEDSSGRFMFWKICIFDGVKNRQSSTGFPS
jgi:hypothetical protein